ncbi:MAG: YceI family protein [Salibacteraceae bacterium]
MKNLVISMLVLVPFFTSAQILKTSSSKVHFFSEAPTEDIEAVNTKATGAIRTENNQLALVIPIKAFKFEKALMEEHFNENYLESDKFKNGTFVGFIDDKINWKKDGEYETSATGKLKIHGVEQERTIKGKLVLKDGVATLSTKFQVKLVDHDIEIPKVVILNIAEVIDVTATLTFTAKQ